MLILSKKISRIASENIMKTKLIVVAGPTAVGKTALGIELAKRFNGEIISGDSQQVYRQLNIGTAKATPEEQAVAVHHLIDVRDVDESYSAYDFVRSYWRKGKAIDIMKRIKRLAKEKPRLFILRVMV